MTRIVATATLGPAEVDAVLAPRQGVIAESLVGPGVFEAVDGPVCDYRRTVIVTSDDEARGRAAVTQEVSYRLCLPYLGTVLGSAYRRELGRIGPARKAPWWTTPDRIDPHGAAVLGCVVALSVITGYLSTLMTQTVTFSAQEFHVTKAGQGVALAVVRGDVVLSIGLVALADRWGRKVIAVWAGVTGSVLTALGAMAPSLGVLVVTQVAARGFVTAGAIAATVLVAETMPPNSRAYAVSIAAMASAVGIGVCLVALPVADMGITGWRVLFVIGLAGAPLTLIVGRRLPESRRYTRSTSPNNEQLTALITPTPATPSRTSFARRLALLAAGSFLLNVFVAPASQFQNEFLRREHHFSAARISLFTILTVLPGAIGIVGGGRLADRRGRRSVGAVALVVGTAATVGLYLSGGWPMWAWSAVAASVGTAVVPALGVYGPELFSTARRGLANGLLTAMGRMGAVLGLVGVGLLADRLGKFGWAFAVVAIGPLALAALLITAFPETAHRELEELNPEDRRAFPRTP